MKFFEQSRVLSYLLFLLGPLFTFGSSARELTVFKEKVLPLLEEYCYDCHGEGAKKGDFAMDELIALGSFSNHSKKWDRIWKNIYNRNMPPANVPQPFDSEISTVLSWIEEASFDHNPDIDDPGHVVLRRLNRDEYENTVQDIFKIEIDTQKYFPADDTGYGFDTIGEVLTLSPLLMEKYLDMAEIVMEKALGPINDQGKIYRFGPNQMKGGSPHSGMRVLASRGSLIVPFTSTSEGNYVAKIRATGSLAGDEFARMIVTVNEDQIEDFSVDAEYPEKKEYEFEFEAKPKFENKISLTFPNDFWDPKNKNPKRRDRNLFIDSIEISSPTGVSPNVKITRSHLLGKWKTEDIDENDAMESLKKWLPRIYRMPLSPNEFSRHVSLYKKMQENGLNPLESLRQTFKAALVSPNFIFREEKKLKEKDLSQPRLLDEFALAHRISYFLWSSVPDDKLWSLAAEGKLRANLRDEVKRMIHDPKIDQFVENFCGQWLQLRDLNLVNPNPKQFPSFTEKVRNAMILETEEFFKYLLTENLPLELLLSADFSMINRELANYYGISGDFDDDFQRVVFQGDDLRKRGGLLTHGSILTITSNPTRTSPVKRGKWVLDNLLAAPPRDPPPGVTELEESHDSDLKKMTFREQMAMHSKNPTCYSCHASMDNLGYALDNFNAVGIWRDYEDGKNIDVTGKLSSGEKFTGVRELQNFLLQNKRQAINRCLAQKLLIYGLGRGLTYKDRLAIDEIIDHGEQESVKLADLVFKVIQSKPFQFSK